jgi:hypothetical protein
MAVKREKNKFDIFNEFLADAEGSFVNLIATGIPWLTSVPPMIMSYANASEVLNYTIMGMELGWLFAIPVAAVVEFLGFAAMYLMVRFMLGNRRKNIAQYKKAPTWAVVVAFLFYLTIILVSNVALDAFRDTTYEQYAVLTTKFLYTLMTIPGAIIVVTRAAHADLLKEVELEKIGTGTSTQASTSTSSPTSTKPKSGSKRKSAKDAIYAFINDWKQKHGAIPTFSEIVDGTKLPDSTVSRWRTSWIQENP